ncbi:MAG: hypothetical protein ACK5B6_10970, partial [Bacteroidia bacterium]
TSTDQATVTVTPLPTVNAGPDANVCNTPNPYTLTGFSPAGGTWTGSPNISGNNFTPNGVGTVTLTYTVTQNGCTATDQVVLTVANPTAANAGADQSVCLNSAPLNLTATPANGTWSGTGVTSGGLFTPSSVGTFTLTYSVGTGNCAVTDTKVITVLALPSVTVADATICAGQNTTLTANGSGATTPYTYSWSPTTGLSATTGASVTANPTSTQTYTVTITSANTCTSTDQATVTVTPLPTVNAGPDANVCNTPNPYTLTGFSPTGGTWSGTGVTNGGVFTPSGVGTVTLTYTVTQNGCTATDQVVLTVANPTAANAGVDQSVCLNSAPINLTATPANGTWSGTGVTSGGVFTPSSVGTFTLTYSVGTGNCAVSDDVIITVLALPSVTVADATICAGQDTTLTANGSGAAAPYTYSWSPSTGLSATTGASVTANPTTTSSYTVTITSANTCTSTGQSIVTVTPLPTLNAGADVGVCNTPNPYTLTGFSPQGGTWSGTGVTTDGVFTPSGVGVVTLTYTVTQNGCSATDQVVLNVTNPTPANAGTDQSVCQNSSPLNLTGTPTGGSWSGTGVSSDGIFTPASVGSFTLTYNFGTGNCAVTDDVIITVLELPIAQAADVSYCIGLNAQLQASASGGLAPYQYTWSPAGGLSATIGATVTADTNSSAMYTVTVSDANQCTGTAQVDVVVHPLPEVEAGTDLSVCNTPTTTQLAGFSPTNGTWSGTGVNTSGAFIPTGLGTFMLTYSYTDNNGCINEDSLFITVTDPGNVNAGLNDSICLNAANIQLQGQPAGGTWAGSTQITPSGEFSPSQVGVSSLSYTVGVGTCAVSDTVQIHTLQLPEVQGQGGTICARDSISLQLTASSGTGGSYTYLWNPSDSLSDETSATVFAFPDTSETYTVVVTDAVGCTNQTQITVQVNQLPVVDAGPDFTVCFTPIPTVLQGALPAGGTWTGVGVNNGSYVPVAPGQENIFYSFTENSTGCTNVDTIIVTANNPDIVNAGNDTSVCITYDPFVFSGQSPSGGTWSGDTQVAQDGTFTATVLGDFTLYYTTGSGTCAVTDSMVITVNPLPVVEAGADTSICVNSPPFSFSGESPVINGTWQWTGQGVSDATQGVFDALISGGGNFYSYYTYTETATGCSNTDSLLVTVNVLTPVSVMDDSISVCLTPFNTMLTASPVGGIWTGNEINFDFNLEGALDTAGFIPQNNGWFKAAYTFTDNNQCVNSDTVYLEVVSPVDADAGPDVSFCFSASDTAQLNGLPANGSWTDIQNPSWLQSDGNLVLAQADTFMAVFTVGTGSCQTWDTSEVVIFPLPDLDAGIDTFRCLDDPCFNLLPVFPVGGLWSGIGITNGPAGTFCSQTALEGNHVIYYDIDT